MPAANTCSMMNVLVSLLPGRPIDAVSSVPHFLFSSTYLLTLLPSSPSLPLSLLQQNKLSGALPVQLSTLTGLTYLCVSE